MGKLLVTGGLDGEVQFWDIEKRIMIKSFQGHSGKIVKMVHRDDGEFLATAGLDGILHIWKTEECSKVSSINIEKIIDM